MPDTSFLDWPFLDQRHRAWAAEVEAWASAQAERLSDEHDADGSVINLARAMGEAGLLRVPCPEDGRLDVRSLCLARDILARHAGLADFAFAMQGSAQGRSRYSARHASARWCCPARALAPRWPPSHSANPRRAAMSRPWRRWRRRMATAITA